MLEIILIRHAAVDTQNRLIGRTDLSASLPKTPRSQAAEVLLTDTDRFCSPAKRCIQTSQWLGGIWAQNPLLWEQNFGDWDGLEYTSIPDIGALPRSDLAKHRPPNGETFLDLAKRFNTFTQDLPPQGKVAILAHAGIIRAALGMALGAPEQGLCFAVDPLSATTLQKFGSDWAIKAVNCDVLQAQP